MSTFKHNVDMGQAANLMPFQVFKANLGFADAGSGAQTVVDISAGFPTDVFLVGALLEIDTVWAGEADATLSIGDVADPDGLGVAFTLDSVAKGYAALVQGAESGTLRYEAAFSPRAQFDATELGDLTAGDATVHILYFKPRVDSV